MITEAKWIGIPEEYGSVCPKFKRKFCLNQHVKKAELSMTAIGIYEAVLNGRRIGDALFAPGCTSYRTRLQYQCYDITDMLETSNELLVTVGTGWHRGVISAFSPDIHGTPCGLLAQIEILYEDGSKEVIFTDTSWLVAKSNIMSSDFYHGEIYDANYEANDYKPVVSLDLPKHHLIEQRGEVIREQEHLDVAKYIITPRGEHVLDMGQNFAGYPEFKVTAKAGDRVKLSFAEILDYNGNFYNENYRSAKAELEYICCEGEQTYKPHFTFYGYRYIRVDTFPTEINPDDFTGIVVYSDMERTGRIRTSNRLLNRLFENALWSQRSNFIDIPTDCPQRDERMGWTGDAQIFCKAASYNYNVDKFFAKWLEDICAEQWENGAVPDTIPNFWQTWTSNPAWGDIICVAPWRLYLMYGNKKVLADNFEAMKKWIGFITNSTRDTYLWTISEEDKQRHNEHFGDWLALDAPYGSYKGATDDDYIGSIFYAYSTSLVIKAGKVLGEDVSTYESLYGNIVRTIKQRFPVYRLQTECILALYFDICNDKKATAEKLVKLLEENGGKLQTGFVGTPYILYALSENGYVSEAYKLLLQEGYPSWLYEVTHGATTIWEHWDGIRDDGKLWSKDMNSYNHYAYGAVVDWLYSVAAGIKPDENYPGFERAIIEPYPDRSLEWMEASLQTSYGMIRSSWTIQENMVRYEIETPVKSDIIINGKVHSVNQGHYVYMEEIL